MKHYCDFIRIEETNEGLFEACKECKRRLITSKAPSGRIDSERYRKEHLRDFAQPKGITLNIFKQYYSDVYKKFKLTQL